MRGRTVFMDSLRAHGVQAIFGNPGTTESPLLDALGDYPDIRYVTCLHEGVAVSAANLYAQASGRTTVANVHVAPGLGNALGSLYGALKSRSPLIMTAGQQDTRMRLREPVLQHDLVAMAAPLVKWATQVNSADEMAAVMQRAFKVANDAPAGPVFVALPINVMEQETDQGAWTAGRVSTNSLDVKGAAELAAVLAGARDPVIVAADDVGRFNAVESLVALADRIGARVYHDILRQQVAFPNDHPSYVGAMPTNATAIRGVLGGADVVLMVGGPFFEEIWFDSVRAIPNETKVVQIAHEPSVMGRDFGLSVGVVGDLKSTLDAVCAGLKDQLDEPTAAARRERLKQKHSETRAAWLSGIEKLADARPMTPAQALNEIAKGSPSNVAVVDEAVTAINDVSQAFTLSKVGDYFGQRGGGIGQGVAGALGVAVALPQRPVLAISGDGSAMYAIQSLWTAAHLQLNIVFVILANREYRVLKHNLDTYRRNFDAASNRNYPHMDLSPTLDFVSMAKGMGVTAERIDEPGKLAAAVKAAFSAPGPHLIEVVVSGKQ